MSVEIINQTFDFYEDSLNVLSERLRTNWLQKLNKCDATDDSLTNLTWLYDMHPVGFEIDVTHKSNEDSPESGVTNCDPHVSSFGQLPFSGSLLDPQVRLDYRTKWTGKPPFSYATLICLAMRELGKPKVTLSDIYGWIMNNFAYYRHTDSSWQNSVRHNLSLNKCFEKVPRDKNERGKGGFWRVNPKHADWLEANLAKCRRAAPPPGPPPPIPRSMLIQQQQGHLPQQCLVMPSSATYSFTSPVTFSHPTETNGFASELVRKVTTASLSPLSASSTSSLSSSPLSLVSSPPPAVGSNLQTATTTISNAILVPTTSRCLISNSLPCVDSDFRLTTYSTQTVQSNQPDSNRCQNPGVSRRRKSPLPHPSELLDHEFYDPRLDELAGCEKLTDHFPARSLHCSSKVASYLSDGTHDGRRPAHWSVLTNYQPHPYRRPCSVSRPESIQDMSASLRKRFAHVKHETSESGLVEEKKHTGKEHTHKRFRLNRPKVESRLLPTRILPPRRRYSRWAHPRSEVAAMATNIEPEKLTPLQSKKIRNSVLSSREKGLGSQTKSDSYLNLVAEEKNYGDEDLLDSIWPPFSRLGGSQTNKKFRHLESDRIHTVAHLSGTTFPKLTTSTPHWLTPQYVPAGLSPHSRNGSNRESTSSAASSSSVGSSLSGHNMNRPDSHLYHSLPSHRQYAPRRVETQTCRQLSPNHESMTPIQFCRLYPTSGEAEAYLGTSPDRLRMPKWASVFLPEGEERELEPIFEKHSHTIQHPFGLLDNFSSNTDELSNCSAPLARTSHGTSSTDSTHDSEINWDQDALLATDRHDQHPISSSPLLDNLYLDSADLDFDTLHGLVEASGPIPLDLDLALTASLNGACSNLSTDSAFVGSCSDLDSTAHSQLSTLLSPTHWSADSMIDQETLHNTWFGNPQSLHATNCLLSMLDGADALLEKPGGSNEPATDSGRLNTPPSH
ncbi:hypothetical protein EG68_03769 [Paragonimus skrjabini miyazakii]|uniref:Fork-head domain-containing protein n=1 Tax=Paragonimus skrjabini miyazakii TaxID=59628 RepID=A0A8S9Z680_9TREM|nr:hypothetical protein EG68_03769 [Paragonimus skrjabini miyazakii]